MSRRTRWTTWSILIAAALVTVAPFLWMLLTSFKSFGETMKSPPTLLPEQFNFDNYALVFQKLPFLTLLSNTVIVTVADVVLTVLFSAMAAYALSVLDMPGRRAIMLSLLAVMMVPGEIFMVPQYQIIAALGLTDTLAALVIPSVFSVFGAFLLMQTFKGIPQELIEAARLDGASHARIFVQIVLPNAVSGLTALAVMTMLSSWTQLLWPIVVNHSIDKLTLGPGLALLGGSYFTESNLIMAAGVMSALPMIFVFIIMQRRFIDGIVHSGMK